MNLNKILSVSGKSGLFLLHKKRTDGLIIKSILDDSVVFASSRIHTFTPLENITIYTTENSIPLVQVLINMHNSKKIEVPSPKAKPDELRSYFSKVLPNFDQEKVYPSDIGRIIKMFLLLEEKNLIPDSIEKINSAEDTSAETVANEQKPAAKKTAKKTSPKEQNKEESSSDEQKPVKKAKTTKKTKE